MYTKAASNETVKKAGEKAIKKTGKSETKAKNKSLNIHINDALIRSRLQKATVSCTSMVVNIFGDVVLQHGGCIWLGSLIAGLEPMGYNERLVRTAVYRLTQQNWLQVKKVGRRSFYSLTDMGRRYSEKAARRIYASGIIEWDGYWTLVYILNVTDDQRDSLQKSLLWQGFNPLVNGVYAHPSAERTSLDETLYDLDLTGNVVVFRAKTEDIHSQVALKNLVQIKWNLAELQTEYREFLAFYQPLSRVLSMEPLSNQTCFLLRCLMIHDYRRILLRDPDFPEAMLPEHWEGFEAYELVKYMYKILASSSVQYIQDSLKSDKGSLPGPGSRFYSRFDGIPKIQ